MSYIKNLSYLSHPEMIISDHKPVSATFELQVKVVVPDREKQTIDEISFKLDKQYNETLPQVELNSYEFKFEKVKFMVEQTQSSSWEEYDSHALSVCKAPPPLDIPKELYRLVQLHCSLMVDSLVREREDKGYTGYWGRGTGVYSVAAVLLKFLRSLEDPVVPRSVHQRCMDASNNPTLCRQVLLQMAEVHRRCFVFIVTFLKKLLEHSQENKMDAKVLASIFGEVLMNSTREEKLSRNKKTLSQINKKKMTFLYQFLANDLTVNYE
uniref:Rho-GAP domain-containing protein n=1 Tax=Amphimedon queenslandica TaxID=400682 RepID=A0A1X7TKR8_AMPQE